MSSGTTVNVRLVRCPKCQRLLPEMPDIPVYKCGGCSTTLQAKRRRQTTSSLPETHAEETNKSDRVSEVKESSSSSHETTLHRAEECASDQNCGTDQIQSGNINDDDFTGKSIVSENESNMSDQKGSEDNIDGVKLEYNGSNDSQKNGNNDNEAGATDAEQVMGAPLLTEVSNNGGHQNDSLTATSSESGSNDNEAGATDAEQVIGAPLLTEDSNNGGNKNDSLTATSSESGSNDNEAGATDAEQVIGAPLLTEDSNNNGGHQNDSSTATSSESGSNDNEAGATDGEQVIGAPLLAEDSKNGSHQNDSSTSTSSESCSSKELAFLENGELLQSASVRTHLKVEDNDESSSFADKVKPEAETDANSEIDSTRKRSNNGELVDTKESASVITTRSPSRESLISDVFVSSPDEQLKQPQETAHCAREPLEQPQETAFHGLGRLRSTDTYYASSNEQLELPQETALHGLYHLRSTDTFYASPNGQLEETSLRGLDRLRSTDTFYASPNEELEQPQETDYRGLDRVRSTDTFDPVNPSSELSATLVDLLKSPTTRSTRAYYDDGVSSYEETGDQLPNRYKHGSKHAYKVANHVGSDVNSRRDRVPISSNYETQQHFRNAAANLPERPRYPGRNWVNSERDEHLPHHSFRNRESLATSHQLPNELYYTSNIDRLANTDQEKLKLLRMVFELQDQLNKASLNDKASGTWKDHRAPMYCNHEVEPEESFHNLVHPRYSGQQMRDGSHWSQQRKYSHIPFSAEAAIGRHQADHSLCCSPQERKWSAQLPPSGLGYNEGRCKVHSRLNRYSSYGSCPSSPQRHVDPQYPQFAMYNRGPKPDDQRHRDYGVREYFKEKNHLPKRHLRPLAGGAPIITCPQCMKQLMLPADFLLLKMRCHRLKCGACSEVLKFSLVKNTHLIPYMPVAEAPPPSEVDEHSDAIHRRNFTSTSHVTDCPSVSCSDDCGRTFCKSCSQRNGLERKTSYHSVEHEKERKRSYLNETSIKGKKPMEYESAGPSTSKSQSKIIPSEIEELREEAERDESSPLHRLMGYSSAREVIYS
ncbi:uncharacterized protein [Euphorbia lathyris]